MKNLLLLGSLSFVFAGCAASNGGGHVVGNSMVSDSKAKKVASTHTCATCGKSGEACACKECGCEECAAKKKAAKKGKKSDCGCEDH